MKKTTRNTIAESPSLKTGKSNLEVFSATLMSLAEKDPDVMVVTSDSRGSGKLIPFGERFPDQLVEVGIAEQNLVGAAAGLASTGKKVFAVSPASFLTTRSLDQLKNDVAYSDFPVVLVGISAGVSYGALGSTHHSLHDIAVLRAIPNLQIMAPADNEETRLAVMAAAASARPVFLKFGKKPMPHLPWSAEDFKVGKANTISQGNDLAIVACGETVLPAFEAAQLLREKGIQIRVISMHTLKPLDEAALIRAADACGAMITVEEHSVHGGLGEACASVLMQNGRFIRFRIVGIPDEDTATGSQGEIFDHYGITGKGLSEKALEMIKQKG